MPHEHLPQTFLESEGWKHNVLDLSNYSDENLGRYCVTSIDGKQLNCSQVVHGEHCHVLPRHSQKTH